MKSNLSTAVAMITLLAALALPTTLAAQDNQIQEPKHDHDRHHRYKLIDLGTFGGPDSYVNAAFALGSTHQISERAVVVGAAATSTPAPPNKAICGGPDGLVPNIFHAFEWRNGELIDLGALPGIECSEATAINKSGEIVGRSGNGVIDPLVGVEELRAVVWEDGQIIDLGTLGGNHSIADDINDRGQVVGITVNAIPDPFSLLYALAGFTNGTQTRAFLWEKGQMHDLGTLGGPDAEGFNINRRGQIFGVSYINSTPDPVTGLPPLHPFVWTKETGMKDLGSLGGALGFVNCECGGFNNQGQVVGMSNLAGDTVADPFFWDGENLIDLFTSSVGGNPLSPTALNDAGEIAGGAVFPKRPFDAFLWKNGVATDLGTVDGDGCSWARAMNNRGQIVGQSFACDGSVVHSFLWEDGSIVDLNALIPTSANMQLVDPLSINDRGEIAGLGLPPGCTLAIGDTVCGHAFVLIPCDTHHSDEGDCGEDFGHAVITGMPSRSSLAMPRGENVGAVGLTSREIAARMQARFDRRTLHALLRR
jgi:probable HAF family extracellular repeat protein